MAHRYWGWRKVESWRDWQLRWSSEAYMPMPLAHAACSWAAASLAFMAAVFGALSALQPTSPDYISQGALGMASRSLQSCLRTS